MLSFSLHGCVCLLSSVSAAFSRRGAWCSILCPLSVSQMMNLERISLKLCASFWSQYRQSSPAISHLKQLGGWAEAGGIYKQRFIRFWNVAVDILEPVIVRLRSRKLVVVEGSSMTQEREPQLLIQVLNASHVADLLLDGGSQIPKISLIYRLK